jgi:hypothetical protein
MRLLLYSGLLYLIGISIILILRPTLMFSPDGKWKEFGMGRSKLTHTWLPFWMFSIIWAIISYIIVLVIAGFDVLPGIELHDEVSVSTEQIAPNNISKNSSIQSATTLKNSIKKAIKSDLEPTMKPGYYILDTSETMKTGIPKYLYLGPEAPNLIYNNTLVTPGDD